MAYQFPPDVQERLMEWMASGKYSSEDDVLRDALRALSDEEQDFAAVEEALADLDRGDPGVPLGQAFDELRAKHGFPRRT